LQGGSPGNEWRRCKMSEILTPPFIAIPSGVNGFEIADDEKKM
jgi:hypothetical protein